MYTIPHIMTKITLWDLTPQKSIENHKTNRKKMSKAEAKPVNHSPLFVGRPEHAWNGQGQNFPVWLNMWEGPTKSKYCCMVF